MASRRTVGLVALAAAAVVGAGAGTTMSLTSSRAPAPSGARGADVAAADLVGTGSTADARVGAPAGEARSATLVHRVSADSSASDGQLRSRRAVVTAAVRKRYPQAQVLAVTLHRDGTWLVVLTLANQRAGIVTVGAHLLVGVFQALPGRSARPWATPAAPTSAVPAVPAPAAPAVPAPAVPAVPAPAVPAAPAPAAPGTGTVGGDGAASGRHW